jgi:hypothetical protein
MGTQNRFLVVVLALAGLAAAARADTVVLTNGTRLSGELRLVRNGIAVQSRTGTVTVPAWRVANVFRGAAPAAPQPAVPQPATPQPEPREARPEPAAAETPSPTQPAAATPQGMTQRQGPPSVARVLTTPATVSFDGASVYEAMEYIRDLTGVNMALAAEVRTAQVPVHLNVSDVPLYTILELILEPANLGYTIRPGEILYVGRRGTLRPVVRVYRVTDLLVSVEDRTGGATGTSARGTSYSSDRSGSEGSSTMPQYGQSSSGARVSTGGSQGRGGAGNAGFSPLSARAENLILLIKSSCGAGTWADPYSSGLIDSAGGRMPAGTQTTPVAVGF